MKFIYPNYIQNFKCDGSLCDSYCCREWKITVDEITKNKYENLPLEKKEKILSCINEKEGDFYPLKLNEHNSCPFLREDCLCDLQKNLGEDYLSDICYSYPRVTNILNNKDKTEDVVLQSLTLSCPIATKLVLFSEDIFFIKSDTFKNRIGFSASFKNRTPVSYEEPLNIIFVGLFILKENCLTIDEKLKTLLKFYTLIDENIDNNSKLSELLNILENRGTQIEILNENNFEIENSILFKKSEFVSLSLDLFDALYNSPKTSEKLKSLQKIYDENFEIFEENIIKSNSLFFKNYLMNEFFMRAYPYAFNESFVVNIKIFILSWYALVFALFMLYMENGLTEERVTLGIRRLVERMDHSKGVMKKIIDIAKKSAK